MKRLDEEKQRLAEEALSRADRIRKRYERIFPEYADDFESSAIWGAVRAASEYQTDKGQTWERWSKMCITNEIKEFLRTAYVRQNRISWCTDKVMEFESDKDPSEEIASNENFERMISMLPSKYTKLMKLIYLDGMYAAEAGRSIGLSDQQSCRLHKQAIEILKRKVA